MFNNNFGKRIWQIKSSILTILDVSMYELPVLKRECELSKAKTRTSLIYIKERK